MTLYCCLGTFPGKTMKLAVELALIFATPWKLSSWASLLCFSFSTQTLKQELKFHLVYFGWSVYSRIWKMLLVVIPWKRVLTVMSNPISGCSPYFSLHCQCATLILLCSVFPCVDKQLLHILLLFMVELLQSVRLCRVSKAPWDSFRWETICTLKLLMLMWCLSIKEVFFSGKRNERIIRLSLEKKTEETN